MYPKAADQNLSLLEVADDWSQEIKPRKTSKELERFLIEAWWRGELQFLGGITRVKTIGALFKSTAAGPLFWIDGEPRPQTVWEYPDGSADVFIGPILKVPSLSPDEWSDEHCNHAFEDIAKHWEHSAFDFIRPIISTAKLAERDFTNWIKAKGYIRPEFWAEPKPGEVVQLVKASQSIPKRISKKKVHDIVVLYIKLARTAGESPTKKGLEKYCDKENCGIPRDLLRSEFTEVMGNNAPGRGRPKKIAKINRG